MLRSASLTHVTQRATAITLALLAIAVALLLNVAPLALARPSGVIVLADQGRLRAFDLARPQYRYPLFGSGSIDRDPAIAAHKRLLAFDRSSRRGKPVVYIAGADGALRRLIEGRQPAFSPVGGRVVVAGAEGLMIVDVANGSHVRQLTNDPNDAHPSWGKRGVIAFDRRSDTKRQVFSIRSDGTRLHQIVTIPVSVERPRWSPDGRSLLVGIKGCVARNAEGLPAARSPFFVLLVAAGCHPSGTWSPNGQEVAIPQGQGMAIVELRHRSTVGGICGVAQGVDWAGPKAGHWLVMGRAKRSRCRDLTLEKGTKVCYKGVCWYVQSPPPPGPDETPPRSPD
ncbi:MAG: hypothetical protein QOJ63_1990 [Solirubrobacteraceae bacterium]|jgi:hypothetical protein|nr:hypothetical protein [Solirubrobacteraceae bacterium]